MANYKIELAKPCNENWGAMQPNEQGRFCLSCKKTVHDFSDFTDEQFIDFWANYGENTEICGNYRHDQLQKPKITRLQSYLYRVHNYFSDASWHFSAQKLALTFIATLIVWAGGNTVWAQPEQAVPGRKRRTEQPPLNKKGNRKKIILPAPTPIDTTKKKQK